MYVVCLYSLLKADNFQRCKLEFGFTCRCTHVDMLQQPAVEYKIPFDKTNNNNNNNHNKNDSIEFIYHLIIIHII